MVDINKLLELEAKATKGKWEVKTLTSHNAFDYGLTYKHLYIQEMPVDVFDENDLEFICVIRSNLRPLLLQLKAARKVVDAARDALDDMDRMFRTTQRLEDAIKELDGEK